MTKRKKPGQLKGARRPKGRLAPVGPDFEIEWPTDHAADRVQQRLVNDLGLPWGVVRDLLRAPNDGPDTLDRNTGRIRRPVDVESKNGGKVRLVLVLTAVQWPSPTGPGSVTLVSAWSQ